ncbi:PAS domain S-box protein [Bacillus sp. Cr_A10]|uniref:PAS domain S-box protein n=1 Tax=Bacillus sp. Cr_A10 TaxID=3033993 RepID=UPI0023DA33FE|nr:PAS domain S-box protein [Bacillus sp. Cr_A10]MDF2066495.1 PAS domain S-box protein [Bacillus sp. Cr_A10]
MNEEIAHIDYREIMEYSLDPLIIHTNLRIIDVNHMAEKFFGAPKENIIGASPLDIFQETSKVAIEKRILSAYQQPAKVIEETIFRMDGTTVDVELYCHPVQIGDTKAIQTYVKDITGRKESETKQKEIIKEINDLSATVVPILNGIAILPLVGSIDEDRAIQILENVPLKVKNQSIECLIIDFSGIYNLDSLVTDYLFKLNSVLSLLGVRSIITGLRPSLALAAIQLDYKIETIPTMSSVKDALVSLGIYQK